MIIQLLEMNTRIEILNEIHKSDNIHLLDAIRNLVSLVLRLCPTKWCSLISTIH